jgi:preprotein translocase subunit SecA
MLKKFVKIFGGDPNKRSIEKFSPVVEQVNDLEPEYEALSDEALRDKTAEFRTRFTGGETLDDLLPEAYAAVREASKRSIGLRHFDVQLIGGIALHQGKIAEMRTGEGKTLVATLPLYLNGLTGKGTHLITVNDYLARRDARWMAPIFHLLGLSVGVLQMAARTENGKKAFLVDLERESPHEDQHQLQLVSRAEAYAADITYGTNSEFGFDYLRDNMAMRMEDRVQRGHYYAIIDEVDNVLIDEARTPLIISGPAQDEAEWYIQMAQVVRQLRPEDYEISEKDRNVTLTEIGEAHVEELLGMALRDPDRPEDVTLEQARMIGYLEQGLRAQYLFRRNKDYLVQSSKVVIIDEFTGRLMPGRRWSDGLHQAVEAKEGVRVQAENVTYATITIQNYFRMYEKLAGMTGTALTEAEEFDKIYKLEVLAIPTNLEYMASRANSDLEEIEDRDEQGYKYNYYARKQDTENSPVFWRRKDFPDVVYRTEEIKLRSVSREILQYHVMGRPILVGTTSVELSERVSNRLRAEPLRRLTQVLLIRQNWFDKNKRDEDGRQVPELQYLYTPIDHLDLTTMRKMCRDLEISFNPEEGENLQTLLKLLELQPEHGDRLAAALKAGIPHEVLNARKHTEESQIIAGAGAFGAVTIATNMAGRGVDIKLGGELAEEIISAVNRVLRRAGYEDPYDMTMDQRRQVLLKIPPAEYGIYDSEVNFFLKHLEDMDKVRSLGGLHVIGSERHEARRIDNQLRGRAARQGDPGSSRFYLSMEDELMRLFGGGQADSLMQRLKIDDATPLEVGLVSRLVEQSQTRVEGANFDVRKHLLEYDDVLNTQRAKIYGQRNRIFTKDDLSEDIQEMLRTESNRRVPEALADEEGPWKLLAWLEQIQPTFPIGNLIYPSYMLKLLAERILNDQPEVDKQSAIVALLQIADASIQVEQDHLLRSIVKLLAQTQDRLKSQVKERLDQVDTTFEGLSIEDDEEEESEPRSPRQILDDLNAAARIPLKLTADQQRALRSPDGSDLDEVIDEVHLQVEASLTSQAVIRLLGSIERRMEESLEINAAELSAQDWEDLSDRVLDAVEAVFKRRQERLLGESGQIARDLETALARVDGGLDSNALYQLLLMIPQGARAAFDRKTHRRVVLRTTRLTYIYAAARLLENRETDEITQDVLAHLQQAQAIMQRAWGAAEWIRLASSSFNELDQVTQSAILNALGAEAYQSALTQALNSSSSEEREKVIDALGRRALTEIYRQLLLSVITELWVDYLTQMEALRVSIGLEAYGQRDPLVQYKSRAFALFQELLGNMRLGVVSRMFTFRPRDISSVQAQTSTPRAEIAEQAEAIETLEGAEAEGPEDVEEEELELTAPDSETTEAAYAVKTSQAIPSSPAAAPAGGSANKNKKRRRRRH